MSQPSGVRSGLLLALIGALIVMRTITQDHSGRTLVDRLLGKKPGDSGSGSGVAAGTPGSVVTTAAGVVHTPLQIGALPTLSRQRRQIHRQGFVTDNTRGAIGTVKPLRPAPAKRPKPGFYAPGGRAPSPVLDFLQKTYPGNWF